MSRSKSHGGLGWCLFSCQLSGSGCSWWHRNPGFRSACSEPPWCLFSFESQYSKTCCLAYLFEQLGENTGRFLASWWLSPFRIGFRPAAQGRAACLTHGSLVTSTALMDGVCWAWRRSWRRRFHTNLNPLRTTLFQVVLLFFPEVTLGRLGLALAMCTSDRYFHECGSTPRSHIKPAVNSWKCRKIWNTCCPCLKTPTGFCPETEWLSEAVVEIQLLFLIDSGPTPTLSWV